MQVNITLIPGCKDTWRNAKWWQDANTRAAIFARFWANVKRLDAESCWEWTGFGQRGYGIFSVGRIRYKAHRFSWLFSRGDIPTGLEVCHRCDNGHCVNPAHLFLGTHRDNHLDAVRKGRKRAWGRQRLNAEQVLEIRRIAAEGQRTNTDIADQFGIARNTVSQIVSRKMWAHLERAS